MTTWCEWNPIIVGIGAAIIGAAMVWVWQRARQLMLKKTLNEQIAAYTTLQQQLDNTQISLKKYQNTTATSPTVPNYSNNLWEGKYHDLLQQYQLQEQKMVQLQQVANPIAPNENQASSAWETNYKQIAYQYINAKERIRGLETLVKQYETSNRTLELSTVESNDSPQAVPSYWKKVYDELKEKYDHLVKQFQTSHIEIDALTNDKETLERAYLRAKEDSEYRELYEALFLQQRAYEQAIVDLEEEITKFKNREI